jgi:hypothetical protein
MVKVFLLAVLAVLFAGPASVASAGPTAAPWVCAIPHPDINTESFCAELHGYGYQPWGYNLSTRVQDFSSGATGCIDVEAHVVGWNTDFWFWVGRTCTAGRVATFAQGPISSDVPEARGCFDDLVNDWRVCQTFTTW